MKEKEEQYINFTKHKFCVKLVTGFVFKTVNIKGKEVKKDINKNVFYPFKR